MARGSIITSGEMANRMPNGSSKTLRVLEEYTDIAPFLEDICRAADANRQALGFLPRSVFDDFARRNHLYALVDHIGGSCVYVGHLMFQLRFPRAQIVQMFTVPGRRREGLAATLLRYLRNSLTEDGFTTIYARVAEDLENANAFWEKQHFYVQRVELGGRVKKRHILVRCHELPTPQLFPRSDLSEKNPLGITLSSLSTIPLYLIDLNVLYDIGPRRFRNTEARALFQADRMNFCRLAVTSELSKELQRTAYEGKTDPMEAYVSLFPILHFHEDKSSSELVNQLAKTIFPNKQSLTPNDESDLRHVATSIQHEVTGFITSDNVLLDAAGEIGAQYGLEILSPKSFNLEIDAGQMGGSFSAPEGSRLSIKEVTEGEERAVRAFLAQLSISALDFTQGWIPTGDQKTLAIKYGVWNGKKLAGYVTWSSWPGADSIVIRAAVNEMSAYSQYAAKLILTTAMDSLANIGPRKLSLNFPARQAILRDAALGIGFRGEDSSESLVKVTLGRVVTPESWASTRTELAQKCKIKLPDIVPTYRTDNQHLEVKTSGGNLTYIPLNELETLLSPALFCLPGRPAVITPVQRNFSELLLACAQKQQQLLPHSSSSIFNEKHYLSGPNTIENFKRGTLILFYESLSSKGRGELIAIARTRKAYVKPETDLTLSDFKQSALSTKTICRIGNAERKTVTVFDNIFPLPNAIALDRLREFGCGRATDLITTRPITDDQLQAILNEALSDE